MAKTAVSARKNMLRLGFAVSFSLAFGSVGWMIGMTRRGSANGTSFEAEVLFALALGTLTYVAGMIVGSTVAECEARYG
jgi:hypothetical protein